MLYQIQFRSSDIFPDLAVSQDSTMSVIVQVAVTIEYSYDLREIQFSKIYNSVQNSSRSAVRL